MAIENMNGKQACAKIMDLLESVDLREEPLFVRAKPLKDLRSAVGRILSGSENPTEVDDEINRRELFRLLEAARKVTGRFDNLQVAEIEKTLFCIYSQ